MYTKRPSKQLKIKTILQKNLYTLDRKIKTIMFVGGTKFVHKTCLIQWLKLKEGKFECSMCKFKLVECLR